MPSSSRVCVSERRVSARRISARRVSARRVSARRVSAPARPRVLSVACARSGGRRNGWMHGRNRVHVLKNRDHGARLFVSRPRHRWEQMLINTRPECTEYDPGMRRRGMMDGSGPERGTRQQSIGLGGASWLCFAPVAANKIGTCWKATSSVVPRKSTSTGPGSWPAAPGTSS